MPIEAYTGLPGHGKTSLMVEQLAKAAKAAKRPLWAAGVDGLQPGLASLLKDPKQWNAVREGETCTCHDTENSEACNAHVIPNGSLIFIDEAWKWFGHLHDAARQATPGHVLGLAEHRHRGIDFVWTFQMPAQIYPFARGMVADHHHVVRRYGTSVIDVFTWPELNDDVKSASKREAAQRVTRALPSDAWQHYKSAEVHTIKRKIPLKVFLLPVVLIAAAALLWFAVNALRPKNMAERITGKSEAAAPAAASNAETARPGPADGEPMTAFQYAQRLLPRFATMPESAPIYDDRPAVSVPDVFCMASGAGQAADGWKAASVTCFTEQGTRYSLPSGEARNLARNGRPYNAFKEPVQAFAAAQPMTGPSGPAPVGAQRLGWAQGPQHDDTGIP